MELSTKPLKLTHNVLSFQSKPGSVHWVHQLLYYFVYVISFCCAIAPLQTPHHSLGAEGASTRPQEEEGALRCHPPVAAVPRPR